MTPDDLLGRLADLADRTDRLARQMADTVALIPMQAELEHALAVAAGKLGSRRWAR